MQTPKSGLKDQISEKLWNGLSEGQRQVLLQRERKRLEVTSNTVDDNIPVHAKPIVKDITKMQMPHTESTGTCIDELMITIINIDQYLRAGTLHS